jgi:hypothetical protein
VESENQDMVWNKASLTGDVNEDILVNKDAMTKSAKKK